MSDFDRELETASRLAREAGALVLKIRSGGFEVEMKPGDEPVTVADRAASDLIVKRLTAAFPGDVVISEERADDLARLAARRVWYIDPIDGTKDFIAGRVGFSVMIGLAIDHQPVLGVVYQPDGDNLFTAAPGRGARHGDRELHVSDVREASQIRLVASASHRTREIDEVKNALGISNELNIGSVGLKVALIALAERDLYVNPSTHSKLWDVCAPEAILRAAGGVLTDAHGAPVRYDLEELRCSRGLVASNGHVHAEVIARLAPLFAAQ